MSGISKLEFDGMTVNRDGYIVASWSKYHYITVYFTCDIAIPPCREHFEIYIDGKKVYQTSIIDFPSRSWPWPGITTPTTITIPNVGDKLTPGDHVVSVKVVEHGALGSVNPIDEFKFYVTITKEEGQNSPYDTPKPPKQPWSLGGMLSQIPWWVWISAGILAFAYFTKPSDIEELKELMKLKLMKEMTEEE